MFGALAQSTMTQDAFGGMLMGTNFFDPVMEPGGMALGIDDSRGLTVAGNPFKSKGRPFNIPKGASAFGNTGLGVTLFRGAGLGAVLAGGYADNGLQGVAAAAGTDVATHAALLRFHYAPQAAAMKKTGALGMVAAGAFSGGSWANTARYGAGLAAGGVGGFVGGAAGGALGGMIGGRAGNLVGNLGGTVAGAYASTAAATALASNPAGWIVAGGVGAMAAGAAAVVGSAAAVGYGTYSTLKAGYRHRQMQKSIHTSGSLAAFHTQGAQTMRQRAVQAIHKSHINARSALGQEANLMHMPSRNYHSKYRRFY